MGRGVTDGFHGNPIRVTCQVRTMERTAKMEERRGDEEYKRVTEGPFIHPPQRLVETFPAQAASVGKSTLPKDKGQGAPILGISVLSVYAQSSKLYFKLVFIF